MNRLDRLISYVAPVRAARRAQARARIKALETVQAYYDGADLGRRGASIRRSIASSETVTARSLPALRSGSHDLIRNNPHARRGKEVLTSNIIGTGILPRFKRGKETVTELQDLARRVLESPSIDYNGQLNYYGLQGLICDTVIESGEALVVRRWTADAFPLKYQVLEPDYLDSTRDTELRPDGSRISQGIEYDAQGRRVAYWLYPEHPGTGRLGRQRRFQSSRVPAKDVAHVYRIDRPGQIRGVPWLAPIMLRTADFSDYEEAQLVRQKVAACFVGVYSEELGGNRKPVESPETMQPGTWIKTTPGSEVSFASPPQVTDYKDYAKTSLRSIASGFGISYEALTGDLENVNFASGKMGRIEMHHTIDRSRWHTFIPQGFGVMMEWFLEGAALIGINSDGVVVRHQPPARQMISPDREVPAKVKQLGSGQRTLRQIYEEDTGRDFEEHLDELAEERQMMADRGIAVDFVEETDQPRVLDDE